MGLSKCAAFSRTKQKKITCVPDVIARFPKVRVTLCACRATPPTCAATGTKGAGSAKFKPGYSTIHRTNEPISSIA